MKWIVAAETIQGRKLFNGGNYSRNYGINTYSLEYQKCNIWPLFHLLVLHGDRFCFSEWLFCLRFYQRIWIKILHDSITVQNSLSNHPIKFWRKLLFKIINLYYIEILAVITLRPAVGAKKLAAIWHFWCSRLYVFFRISISFNWLPYFQHRLDGPAWILRKLLHPQIQVVTRKCLPVVQMV